MSGGLAITLTRSTSASLWQ